MTSAMMYSRPPHQGSVGNYIYPPPQFQYYPNNAAPLINYATALRQNVPHYPGPVQLPTGGVRRQVRFEVIKIGDDNFLDEPLKLSYQNYTPNEHILCQRYHELERTRQRYECNWLPPNQLRHDVWKPMLFERQQRQDGLYSYGMLPAPYKVVPDPEPIPWIETPQPVLATLTPIAPSTSMAITKDTSTEPVLRPPQISINWQNRVQQEQRAYWNLNMPPQNLDMLPRNLDMMPRNLDMMPRNLDMMPRNLNIPPRSPDMPPRNLGILPPRNLDMLPPRNLDMLPPRNLDMLPPRNLDIIPPPNLDTQPRFREFPRNDGFQFNRGPGFQRIPPGLNFAQIYGSSFFNNNPGPGQHFQHYQHQLHAGQRRQPLVRINHFQFNHHHNNFLQYRC